MIRGRRHSMNTEEIINWTASAKELQAMAKEANYSMDRDIALLNSKPDNAKEQDSALADLIMLFAYNDIEQLKKLCDENNS